MYHWKVLTEETGWNLYDFCEFSVNVQTHFKICANCFFKKYLHTHMKGKKTENSKCEDVEN